MKDPQVLKNAIQKFIGRRAQGTMQKNELMMKPKRIDDKKAESHKSPLKNELKA